MALQTKEFIGSTSDSQRWTWKIIVYEESASIVNKTSTIKIESYIGRPSWQSTSYFGGSATFGFQAGDLTYSHEITDMYETNITAGSWRLVDSHTFTVSNKGTKASPTSITVKGTLSGASFNPNNASASGTFTLTALHDGPVFSSMTITENSSVLQNISLASNHFVPYLSNKTITITASASDGASITQYKIINGTTQFTSTTNTLTLNFANVDMYYYYETSVSRYIPQIIVELTDSLGGVSSYNYTNTYYDPYEKPNLIATSSSVKRNGQLTGKAKLNINGTYANVTIGNKANSISYFRYKYWKTTASEPSSWFNIPYSSSEISGGTINKYDWEVSKYVNNTWTPIEDVDSESAYYFKVNIQDGFSQSSTITLTCPRGEYIRALLKDRVDFKRATIKHKDIEVKPDVLYTGTLLSQNNISLNVNDYSKLRIYAHSYSCQVIFDLDLTYPTPHPLNADRPYVAGGVCSYYPEDVQKFEYHICEVEVNTAKTVFYNTHMGYTRDAILNLRDNNTNYYIYKIEGFK